MPNKAAKIRKQERAKINDYLNKNGRTTKQIKRIKLRNIKREERIKKRRLQSG
jgi:hypothetical protein